MMIIFFKRLKLFLILSVLLSLVYWLFVQNYSFLFKTKIVGEVQSIEKVGAITLVAPNGSNEVNPQIFSLSVAIKDLKTNEIHMASSEDRKWAAAQKGNCVVAAFFPYAPWQLSKGATYHSARLLKNYTDCSSVDYNESVIEKIKFFFLSAE